MPNSDSHATVEQQRIFDTLHSSGSITLQRLPIDFKELVYCRDEIEISSTLIRVGRKENLPAHTNCVGNDTAAVMQVVNYAMRFYIYGACYRSNQVCEFGMSTA